MKKLIVVCFSAALAGSAAFAQNLPAQTITQLREIHGQTIISNKLPAADLTFGREFRYVGGQTVNLCTETRMRNSISS